MGKDHDTPWSRLYLSLFLVSLLTMESLDHTEVLGLPRRILEVGRIQGNIWELRTIAVLQRIKVF